MVFALGPGAFLNGLANFPSPNGKTESNADSGLDASKIKFLNISEKTLPFLATLALDAACDLATYCALSKSAWPFSVISLKEEDETFPPFLNPGSTPALMLSRNPWPNLFTEEALMTYSPSESIAGIESDLDVPGPET